MSNPRELRVAVVGAGRLGSAHARVYSKLPGCRLVAVADTDAARAEEIAAELGARALFSHRDVEGVDAVSVATPTVSHREVAEHFLAQGVAVLVEKPMTRTVEEAERLIEVASANGAVLQVGHIERFNPALVAALPHVREPMFIECRRVSPYPFRSTDVGVVHDLMIHDIDIVLHLARSEVVDVAASALRVLSKTEDVANARLVFRSGLVADVTASRVSMKSERKLRIFGRALYVSLDLLARKGLVYRPTEKLLAGEVNVEAMTPADVKDPKAFVFSDLISVKELEVPTAEPLAEELASFLSAARGESPPVVDGAHGLAAIRTAEAILRAVASGAPSPPPSKGGAQA
jgi:predicted dehydrogenase